MMNKFSQKDPRWGNLGIGNPMRDKGCLITCIGMIVGKTPDRILSALNSKNCFNAIGELIWVKAVAALGLKEYEWKPGNSPIIRPIICETDHFADQGYPQHFYVALTDGTINDPLDGMNKPNPYNKVSQRYLG